MELNQYSTIIFDAADTLIELSPTLRNVIMEFSESELQLPDPETRVRDYIAASELWVGERRKKENSGAPKIASSDFFTNMILAGLRAILPDTEEEELLSIEKLLRKRFKGMEWVAVPDAAYVLESLTEKGNTLGVVSNFTPDLPNILENQGLNQYLKCIVVSSIVGVSKPDPKIMAFATNELSVPAEECVYIGDSPFDVQCAKDAGMVAVWLNEDNREMPMEVPHKPDVVIQKLRDFADLIINP